VTYSFIVRYEEMEMFIMIEVAWLFSRVVSMFKMLLEPFLV
jgi:hypothetical protein